MLALAHETVVVMWVVME